MPDAISLCTGVFSPCFAAAVSQDAASIPSVKKTAHSLPADSLAYALLAAARVIAAVCSGRTLDAALASCWQRDQPAAAVAAQIQDLSYGTLRMGERNAAFLRKLLRSPLKDATASALLEVSLFRLQQSPDNAHTTVDQAVEAMATLEHGKFRSLSNAVLRNFLRQQTALIEGLSADPAAYWQHPAWWIERLQARYPDHWQAILQASNAHPPMTLRVNRRRVANADDYVARLAAAGIEARALDDTAVMLTQPQGVDQLPGFREGDASVQDWGAQSAAALLDASPGMRVLDACAAPGGKTAHVLEQTDVTMTALELDPKRARRIHENLARLQLDQTAKVSVKVADSAALTDWWDGQPFDRILADVPCSASGVVRRHPDIKWLRRSRDIEGFATSQSRIMDALWQTLAPGGTMLYCTCSIFAEENDMQVTRFLSRHADAVRVPINAQPDLQLLPTMEHDGFYYARLQKHA